MYHPLYDPRRPTPYAREQSRKPWLQQEDQVILSAVQHAGFRWRSIAALLPGRTDDAIRNRWRRLQEMMTEEEAMGIAEQVERDTRIPRAIAGHRAGTAACAKYGSDEQEELASLPSTSSNTAATPTLREHDEEPTLREHEDVATLRDQDETSPLEAEGSGEGLAGVLPTLLPTTSDELLAAASLDAVPASLDAIPAGFDLDGAERLTSCARLSSAAETASSCARLSSAAELRQRLAHTREGRRVSWAPHEDDLIRQNIRHYGTNWTYLASVLPGRTEHAIRNRWHRLQTHMARCAVEEQLLRTGFEMGQETTVLTPRATPAYDYAACHGRPPHGHYGCMNGSQYAASGQVQYHAGCVAAYGQPTAASIGYGATLAPLTPVPMHAVQMSMPAAAHSAYGAVLTAHGQPQPTSALAAPQLAQPQLVQPQLAQPQLAQPQMARLQLAQQQPPQPQPQPPLW